MLSEFFSKQKVLSNMMGNSHQQRYTQVRNIQQGTSLLLNKIMYTVNVHMYEVMSLKKEGLLQANK